MRIRFAAVVALLGAATAFGQTWNEVGDAPQSLPGQSTGSGSLTTINGAAANGNDADIYTIHIDDPAAFVAAVTVAGGSNDTQLFLFDTAGLGVTFDDDAAVLSRRFGTRSIIQGSNGRVPAAGDYYLAISGYDNDPTDSAGNEIWLDTPFNVQRAPDGAGASNPLGNWTGGTSLLTNYTITLRGASGAGGLPRPVPEPTTLMAAGLGGLLVIRRRR